MSHHRGSRRDGNGKNVGYFQKEFFHTATSRAETIVHFYNTRDLYPTMSLPDIAGETIEKVTAGLCPEVRNNIDTDLR